MAPYSSFAGALDLATDTENPYLKLVATNASQYHHIKKRWANWKTESKRCAAIGSLKEGYYIPSQLNKKTNGLEFDTRGVQTLTYYHEKGMEIHPLEVMRMESVRVATETDLAKAASMEEADRSKSNASAH